MLIGSECLRGRLNPTCHLSLNVLVVTLFEGQYFLVICVGFDGKGQDCLKDDNIVDYLNTGGLHIAHFQLSTGQWDLPGFVMNQRRKVMCPELHTYHATVLVLFHIASSHIFLTGLATSHLEKKTCLVLSDR